MRRVKASFSTAILAAFVASVLVLSTSSSVANICVENKLKPLRHVGGIVVDTYGRPIPDAKVEILKSGTEFVSVRTDEKGKFSFEHLDAGCYEIQAERPGFRAARNHIVVVRPKTSSKRMLLINLIVGFECPDIRIVERG